MTYIGKYVELPFCLDAIRVFTEVMPFLKFKQFFVTKYCDFIKNC